MCLIVRYFLTVAVFLLLLLVASLNCAFYWVPIAKCFVRFFNFFFCSLGVPMLCVHFVVAIGLFGMRCRRCFRCLCFDVMLMLCNAFTSWDPFQFQLYKYFTLSMNRKTIFFLRKYMRSQIEMVIECSYRPFYGVLRTYGLQNLFK